MKAISGKRWCRLLESRGWSDFVKNLTCNSFLAEREGFEPSVRY